jgi:putative tricarboxylic transport membrane protein
VLHVPRTVLMPMILLFCVVGAFAINNSVFDVGVMLAFGLLAYLMEANGFPIAPTILGVVLGAMLEQNFVTSMIKAGGNPMAFFERPLAGALGAATILVWLSPLVSGWLRRRRHPEDIGSS